VSRTLAGIAVGRGALLVDRLEVEQVRRGLLNPDDIDETQELNYKAICKAIVEKGFTGYLAQEFIPKHNPMTSLEQAFRICDV
jgi:hypothetical protein